MKSKNPDNIFSIDHIKRKARILLIKRAVFWLALFVLITAAGAYLVNREYKRVFRSYEVTLRSPMQDVGNATFRCFGKRFLSYNTDGIRCIGQDGKAVWTGAYQMEAPIVEVNGNYAAAADRGGRVIYIYDQTGELRSIKTAAPIIRLSVTSGGIVAAAQDEGTAVSVYFYDYRKDEGRECIYGIHTTMDGSGYPLAFSASSGGRLAAAATLSENAGRADTRVSFYDFSAAGKNYSDNKTISYHYAGDVVPVTAFLNDKKAFALSDSRLIIYEASNGSVMKSMNEVLLSGRIHAVFNSEKFIGIVFDDPNISDGYRMDIYNSAGEKTGVVEIDSAYREIVFSDDRAVVLGDRHCKVYKTDGRLKADIDFGEDNVRLLIPQPQEDRFIAVTDSDVISMQFR
ncbi:hypothetical protein SAMN02910370_01464 [Lachnospiraceae bacterium XPB1003]|nr:hypothetical protein SAMN02910370_01464 [Lachnospiraceae bacterium XPB1003]